MLCFSCRIFYQIDRAHAMASFRSSCERLGGDKGGSGAFPRRRRTPMPEDSRLLHVTRQKARFDGVKPVLDGGRHASPNLMRRRARMEAACRDAGGARRRAPVRDRRAEARVRRGAASGAPLGASAATKPDDANRRWLAREASSGERPLSPPSLISARRTHANPAIWP